MRCNEAMEGQLREHWKPFMLSGCSTLEREWSAVALDVTCLVLSVTGSCCTVPSLRYRLVDDEL